MKWVLWAGITGLWMISLTSCVSMKKFNSTKESLTAENERLRIGNMELETAATELKSRIEQLSSEKSRLEKQLEDASYSLNIQRQKNSTLEKEIQDLQSGMESLKSGSTAEIEKLMSELNSARDDLNRREDKLRDAELELKERTASLAELQQILERKEQAVKELKEKVMNALMGFQNNGLTVHEKNGKVYVSLEEKLLFKTGKWDVDPNGQKALGELGRVLAQNPDINIMVEGHTDDVPMRGSGEVKDNWDLSVMRATAVTKILTGNKEINPNRIIAAGRSEYWPLSLDKTPEGRQMNRRTEIILTPNLDELLKIIEVN